MYAQFLKFEKYIYGNSVSFCAISIYFDIYLFLMMILEEVLFFWHLPLLLG